MLLTTFSHQIKYPSPNSHAKANISPKYDKKLLSFMGLAKIKIGKNKLWANPPRVGFARAYKNGYVPK